MLNHGYGILKRLKKGIRIYIFVTFHCQLNCSYCSNKPFEGDELEPDPQMNFVPEMDWRKWVDLIETFPVRVREIVIEGGETLLYPGIGNLINALIASGRFVTLYTNLELLNDDLGIEPSNKLRIQASAHLQGRNEISNEFCKAYTENENKYRIDVDVLGNETRKTNGLVRFNKILSPKELRESPEWTAKQFRILPNGEIHISKGRLLSAVYEKEYETL